MGCNAPLESTAKEHFLREVFHRVRTPAPIGRIWSEILPPSESPTATNQAAGLSLFPSAVLVYRAHTARPSWHSHVRGISDAVVQSCDPFRKMCNRTVVDNRPVEYLLHEVRLSKNTGLIRRRWSETLPKSQTSQEPRYPLPGGGALFFLRPVFEGVQLRCAIMVG